MPDRITDTLHHLMAMIDGYADELLRARHGITYSQFEFLAELAFRQPVDISTLARRLFVTKAAVSKRTPSLVAAGLVETYPAAGRRVMLQLTARGAELVQAASAELDGEFRDLFTHPALADLDVERLHNDLRTILALVSGKDLA